MNEQSLKLLEKALLASPGDWETRAYLIDQYLALGNAPRAAELLREALAIPDTEGDALRKARVEVETSGADAQVTIEGILKRNKGCAQAYLLLAKLFLKRGLRDEARRKYGAATVIDESLSDPELEATLGLAASAPMEAPLMTPANDAERGTSDIVTPAETAAAMEALALPDRPEEPRVTFDDIGGMQTVIERIRMNIIYPFKNPEIFKKFNKKPGGGILMYGPPGCGKTHIARATAGESGAVFMSIAITDVLSKWLGESERRLHEIFEMARRRSPSVVFIDEIDAIGVSRADAGASIAPVVNVLLTELDGISARNENLMVLAATNTPWRVDSALRRPGRFDRVLFVPPPDEAARAAILKIVLRDMPAEGVNVEKLARLTERFSGADLRALVERATEKAIADEMRTGRPAKITQSLLADAAKETRPSTTEWLETARSYASYANRAGLYDDLVEFFEKQ
jgi:SpoVK/Ycf46/Vps4 family AAA+-type ATPase